MLFLRVLRAAGCSLYQVKANRKNILKFGKIEKEDILL